MRLKGLYVLALYVAIFGGSTHAATPVAPSIEVIPMESPTLHELVFAVAVHNPTAHEFKIQTQNAQIVDYQIGHYRLSKNLDGVFFNESYIVLSGEKKIIHVFRHDTREFPFEDASSPKVKVWVEGFSPAEFEFERQKKNFFTTLADQIFKSKAKKKSKSKSIYKSASRVHDSSSVKAAKKNANDQALSPEDLKHLTESTDLISQTVSAETTPEELIPTEPVEEIPAPIEEIPAPVEVVEEPKESAAVLNPVVGFDTTPPSVPVVNAVPAIVNQTTFSFAGTKDDNSSIWVDGVEVVSVDASTSWQHVLSLTEGVNLLSFSSKDAAGNESAKRIVSIERDTIQPSIISMVVEQVGATTATIRATMDEDVTGRMLYEGDGIVWDTVHLGPSTQLVGSIIGLTPDTDYTYSWMFWDEVNPRVNSQTYAFRTAATPLASDFLHRRELAALGSFVTTGGGPMLNYEVVDDMNGDGIADFIMVADIDQADPNSSPRNQRLYLAYSSADGDYAPANFYPMSTVPAPYHFKTTVVGDLNGDSYRDLVIAGPGLAYVVHSTPDGTRMEFSLHETVSPSPGDWSLRPLRGAHPDFNGDGVVDFLATRNFGGRDQIGLILSNGASYNPNVVDLGWDVADHRQVQAFSDSNGDGRSELALIDIASNGSEQGLWIYPSPSHLASSRFELTVLGAGPITRSLHDTSNFPATRYEMDIDENGAQDLIFHNGVDPFFVITYFSNTGTELRDERFYSGITPEQMYRLDDMNGDGTREVLMVGTETVRGEVKHRIYVFYSESGALDLSQAPEVLDEFDVAPGMYQVRVRPRTVGGTTYYDVLLRAENSANVWLDYLYERQ